VEDVGIVLGQGIEKALGDKRGIHRYGWANVPMDAIKAGMAGLPNWIAPFHEEDRGARGVGDGFGHKALWSEPLSSAPPVPASIRNTRRNSAEGSSCGSRSTPRLPGRTIT